MQSRRPAVPSLDLEINVSAWRARLSRRTLAGLAASGIVLSAAGLPPARGASARQQAATPEASTGGLASKGVNYDVGTDYVPELGDLTVRVWDTGRVQREIAVIHDDLHCNAIGIYGTEIDRLAEGAAIAAEQGLQVWIQPRLIDAGADALIDHLTETAREAERLRADYPDVTLNLGVEWTIFAAGIIEGENFEERLGAMLENLDQLPVYNERLNALLADANAAAREVFGGPLTYGSGFWEGVDWSDFDIVGVDLYRDQYNRDSYVDQLRSYHRHGKPVVITEFGCCTYEGAEDAGPAGFMIVDWEADPPELDGEYVRGERVQAGYIVDLLRLYEDEDVHGAFVFTFVEPEMTYSPDPRYDLDMASFGIVKVYPEASGQGYEATGYWEPKAAFQAIARQYGAE